MTAAVFGSAGTYLTGATSATMNVAVPSGVASGDIIIVVAYLDGTATVSGLASGFAQATGSPVSPTNQAHRFYVMWKRATGADAGTYNFTLSASTYREAVAVRYTGAVTSGDPWDATNTATANNPNAPLTTPPVSVTTTGADRLLVFAASYWAGQAWTAPAGFTERVDAGSEFTVDDLAQAVAGSSGSVSTAVGSTSFSIAAWLGALKPAAGAGTSVAVNQATETDTARAVGKAKAKAVGQATETGTARPVGKAKAKAINRATVVDTAQVVGKAKAKAVARAAETDTANAFAVQRAGSAAIGQAAETGLARAIGKTKALAAGRATATDTARLITPARSRAVAIGRAAETDTAAALGRAKTRTIGRAAETDTAAAVTPPTAEVVYPEPIRVAVDLSPTRLRATVGAARVAVDVSPGIW